MNKIIILKPDQFDPVPLFCPLCHFPMLTKEDAEAYRARKMCDYCYLFWGNREIEINHPDYQRYIKKRIFKPVII